MKTTKDVLLSKCCDAPTSFCPPAFKEEGFHMCEKCGKRCKTHWKEVVAFIKISDGHYRPV